VAIGDDSLTSCVRPIQLHLLQCCGKRLVWSCGSRTSVAETVLLKCSCVRCKVDKLKDGERAEMTSVLDLRVLNRHKVSDGYTGVCCTCRRPRSGSMLRCQLCLELFHCMSLQHDSLRFFLLKRAVQSMTNLAVLALSTFTSMTLLATTHGWVLFYTVPCACCESVSASWLQ